MISNEKSYKASNSNAKNTKETLKANTCVKTNICKIKCLTSESKEYAFYDKKTYVIGAIPTKDIQKIAQCEAYAEVCDRQSCHGQIRDDEEDIFGDSGISSGSGSTNSNSSKKNSIQPPTGVDEDLTKVPWFMGPLLR